MSRQSNMFRKILFIAFGIVLVCGTRIWMTRNTPHPTFAVQKYSYQLNPPSQSLSGTVTSFTGSATMLTRDENEPVDVALYQTIKESESVSTGARGALTITFSTAMRFGVQKNTTVAFPSTNPAHFLATVEGGAISYTTDTITHSISIRALHGLFALIDGAANLSILSDSAGVVFTVRAGKGMIGYIDDENKTQTIEVLAGETVNFDDRNRTVTR